jgi:hypothetical protein
MTGLVMGRREKACQLRHSQGYLIANAHRLSYRPGSPDYALDLPGDCALLRRKDDDAYQTESALFRQMLREFRPPAWCQEILVIADAASASRPHMRLIQELGSW